MDDDETQVASTPTPHPDIPFSNGVKFRTYHDRHYDWKLMKREDAPPGAVMTAGNENGQVSVRLVRNTPDNYTDTEVPAGWIEQQQWANTLCQVPWSQEAMESHPGGPEGYEADRVEAAKLLKPRISVNAMIAKLMREAGYERHVPLDAITHVECPDDPELEQYLNIAFEAKGRTDAPSPVPDLDVEEEKA